MKCLICGPVRYDHGVCGVSVKYQVVQDTYGTLTKDYLDKLMSYAINNELDLIQRMLNRGNAVYLEKGMTVYVSDAGFAVHQIRVADTEIELFVVRESIKNKCDN